MDEENHNIVSVRTWGRREEFFSCNALLTWIG